MDENHVIIFSSSFIISTMILIILFAIGLYLQIRIIIISKRHKSPTWKIDISHSVIMTIYFSFRIFFQKLIDIIPTFHQHCGVWFCYLALFIQIFSGLMVVSNSLVVALYKYLYIVRHDLFCALGGESASVVLIWSNLFIQAALSLSAIVRPSFPRFSSVNTCLGINIEKSDVSPDSMLRRFFFCGLDNYKEDEFDGIFSQVMNATNITGCFITSVIFFVVLTNLIEMFLYQRIFSRMKRYLIFIQSYDLTNIYLFHILRT